MVHVTKPKSKPAVGIRLASIAAAKAAGAEVAETLFKGEGQIKDFALRVAIALKLSPGELQKEAELEGASMPKAEYKYSSIIAHLTGFSKLKERKELDGTEKTRLGQQVSYIAKLTEALELFIRTEKLPITGALGEFEKIAQLRDDTTVTAILERLKTSKRPKLASGSNENKLQDDDLLKKVADAYRSSREPIATFKTSSLQLPQQGIAYAIVQSGEGGLVEVYDVVQAKTKSSVELLREVETLPSLNDDKRLNFVLDLLYVASKACPDRPGASLGAKSGRKTGAKDLDDNRQFFFDPARDSIFVGYGRSTSLPSFKVGSLAKWPDAPRVSGLISTLQRRKVDPLANRFDRIRLTLQTSPREDETKWLSKVVITPHGSDKGQALQVDPFAAHRFEFFRPTTAGAKWDVEFEFEHQQLQQLCQDHLGPYARSKKSDKDARIASLRFSKDGTAFSYPGITPVGVSCTVATPLKKRLDVQFVGRDLAQVVEGILSLNASGPVSGKADRSGLIVLAVTSDGVPFEFYIATVPPGSSERSSRFYSSVKRELEDGEAATEQEAAA